MKHPAPVQAVPVVPPPLELSGVTRRHGARTALAGVDLQVRGGEVHGLLGPNGAGKTTLLRIVLGLLRPHEGTVQLHGRSHDRDGVAALDGVAGFVDAPRAWPHLSARATLRALARLDGTPAPDAEARIARVLDGVGLTDRADEPSGRFSTGLQQRLGLAAALLREPDLLVLDEPTSGMDPASARATGEQLRELADAGSAVLVSSHLLADVQRWCDRVTVLREGRVVFTGSVEELRARAAVPEHRLQTTDDDLARALAPPGTATGHRDGGLRLRCSTAELDALVLALAARGVPVRGLATGLPELEDVFLALTAAPTTAQP